MDGDATGMSGYLSQLLSGVKVERYFAPESVPHHLFVPASINEEKRKLTREQVVWLVTSAHETALLFQVNQLDIRGEVNWQSLQERNICK